MPAGPSAFWRITYLLTEQTAYKPCAPRIFSKKQESYQQDCARPNEDCDKLLQDGHSGIKLSSFKRNLGEPARKCAILLASTSCARTFVAIRASA